MKFLLVPLVILSLSISVLAQIQAKTILLLSCSPPAGIGLQEIRIVQSGNRIMLGELSEAGAKSEAISISMDSWQKKVLRWNSKTAGQIEMNQIKHGVQTLWRFKSVRDGLLTANGYCQ